MTEPYDDPAAGEAVQRQLRLGRAVLGDAAADEAEAIDVAGVA